MESPHEPTGETAEGSGERATTHLDPPEGGYSLIELAPGEHVGRYTVVRRVGAGAMGVVYDAHDPRLDRRVAIKVLRQRAVDPKESAVADARLLREARALAQLSHPNVVPVYDVGTTVLDGQEFIFLAMELVEGVTLRAWIKDQRDPRRILAAMKQAGRGLAAAHAAGLIHRDFKLDNVIIDATGRARVMDFGLARPQAETDDESDDASTAVDSVTNIGATLTRAGTVMGTPVYMSPEQHVGRPLDARSDQFSFCVALYEALYGRRPFIGATTKQLARAKLRGVMRKVQAGKPLIELAAVIQRGLDPNPALRWPSIPALLRRLRPKPRRPIVAVAAAAVAVVGIGTAALLFHPEHTPCRDAEERLADVWNGETREAIRGTFQATRAPAAEDTWEVVSKRVDAYAAAWTSAWEQTCRAAVDASAEADAAIDRQALCLDRRRAELVTALDVLRTLDRKTLARAPFTVAELTPPEACQRTDLAGRAFEDEEPPPGTAAAEAIALYRRAHVRWRAGQYSVALGEGFAALALASVANDQKTIAKTELLVGLALAELGELDVGERLMTSAVTRAESVEDDYTATSAAAHLCHLVGVKKYKITEGLRWCRMGRAFAERIPEDTARLAHVLENEASILDDAGSSSEAIAQIRRAIELREIGPPSQSLAMALNNLGIMLSAQAQYDEAREHLERSLAIRREILGPAHPDTGMTYINLGALEAKLQRWELAIEQCERGLQIYRASVGDAHPAIYSGMQIIAAAMTNLGRYDEAVALHEKQIHVAEALHGPDHVLVADAWANLGAVYGTQNRFEEAESAVARALATYTATEADESKVAFLHHNLGVFAMQQRKLDRAEEQFRHALDLWKRAVGPEHSDLGYPLGGLGQLLLLRDRPREARPYLERARRVSEPLTRAPRLAVIDFAYARTLWIDVDERTKAWALVERAREELVGAPALYDTDKAELEAWIEAHRDELPVAVAD